MSGGEGKSTLLQAMKDLSVQWENTRAYWRDVKAMEFERKYLEGMPNLVARTSTAMDELSALIRRVEVDCE